MPTGKIDIEKQRKALAKINKVLASDEFRLTTRLFILGRQDLLSPRGQSMASCGFKCLIDAGIENPWVAPQSNSSNNTKKEGE